MAQGKRRRAGKATAEATGPATVLPFPAAAAPPARTIPRARRVAYLSVPFVLFFGLLGAVETFVRLTRPYLSTLEVFVQAPEQQRGFRDLHEVNVFEGDPLLFWRLAPGLQHVVWDFTPVTTNSQGLRYPRPVGGKAAGTFRIACFGDSITFGYRVPTVWPERPQDYDRSAVPYAELLEAGLKAANPGQEVEVVPLAVPGFSSHQGRAWVRRDIGRLAPDVLVANYGWNDINLRSRTDRESMSTTAVQVVLRSLMTRSQALVHASVAWRKGKTETAIAPRSPVTRVLAQEYAENLLEIARLAREHGSKVIVMGPFYRDPLTEPGEAQRIAEHRKMLREVMAGAGVAYLEIPELHETAWPRNEALFGERIHPSFLGHRLIANRLAERMAAQKMLGRLQPPRPLPVS